MHSESIAKRYEQAVNLAESGQYEQALAQMQEYLRLSPEDGKALNDAGTILFCMHRGAEAIGYFQKAMMICKGDELTQVYWNLCEAYLQENRPEAAAGLFDRMQKAGILNIDILNRCANGFLQKNELGRAIEIIMRSLRMSEDQNILKPMLEVIRNHRAKATLFVDSKTVMSDMLVQSLSKMMPTELCVDGSAEQIQSAMEESGISIFVGCGSSLIQSMQCRDASKTLVVLDEQDIYGPIIGILNGWMPDAVIACASNEAVQDLKELTGLTEVIQAEAAPDVEALPLYEKKQGLRIAAIGPWNIRGNPMFLLQCFQKLHYLEPDSRLYLCGEFEDAGLQRYMEHLAESMDLDNVVFFDGPVKNLSKWLKDKHYVVSTAVDGSSLAAVWSAMACGLKPVIHRFAGAEEIFGKEFIFDIAEEFCQQIQKPGYEPNRYRHMASERFSQNGLSTKVHTLLCKLEKELTAPINTSPSIQSGMQTPHMMNIHSSPEIMPEFPSSQNTPLPHSDLRQTPVVHPNSEPMQLARSIDEIAQEALNASKSLKNLMKKTSPANREGFSTTREEQDPIQQERVPQEPDTFKYNFNQGLSIDDLMPTPAGESKSPF